MIQATPPSHSSMQTSLSAMRTESDTRSSCSSTCSSERLPRSTSNTLLASSSGLRASTSFDCGELQDPDSIWRRRPVKNKVKVLLVMKKSCDCCKQVGRVNSFGRYQPGLDLAPQMSRTEVIYIDGELKKYCCQFSYEGTNPISPFSKTVAPLSILFFLSHINHFQLSLSQLLSFHCHFPPLLLSINCSIVLLSLISWPYMSEISHLKIHGLTNTNFALFGILP